MRTYTNVVLEGWEIDAIKQVSHFIGAAYPDVHKPMPRKHSERLPDHVARVVFQLTREPTQCNYEIITQALQVVEHLRSVVERESHLDYWLDDAEQKDGKRPEPSDVSFSPYGQLRTIAGIRAGQVVETHRALGVLRRAATLATPRSLPDTDDDYYSGGHSDDGGQEALP